MIWLPATLMSCLIVELFAHIPIAQSATRTISSCVHARRIIASRAISDHWKEKIMPAYALRMGRQSLTLAGWFAIFAITTAAAMAIMGRALPEAGNFMESGRGLAFSCIVSLLYVVMRRRFVRA